MPPFPACIAGPTSDGKQVEIASAYPLNNATLVLRKNQTVIPIARAKDRLIWCNLPICWADTASHVCQHDRVDQATPWEPSCLISSGNLNRVYCRLISKGHDPATNVDKVLGIRAGNRYVSGAVSARLRGKRSQRP